VQIDYRRELYMAAPREILNLVAKAPAAAKSALVVGHNPGLGNFANCLAGSGEADQFAKLRKKFPTGGIAVLQFDVADWAEIGGEGGRLVAFMRPRDCA
jgi:phosphohistidine phosphatase